MLLGVGNNTDADQPVHPGNLVTTSLDSIETYSKTCVNGHVKIYKTNMTNGSLMKVESKFFAECSPWSILQYFWPALSDNWS